MMVLDIITIHGIGPFSEVLLITQSRGNRTWANISPANCIITKSLSSGHVMVMVRQATMVHL